MWNSQFELQPGEAVVGDYGHYFGIGPSGQMEPLYMVDRQSLGLPPMQDPGSGVADMAILTQSELAAYGLSPETAAPFAVSSDAGSWFDQHGDEIAQGLSIAAAGYGAAGAMTGGEVASTGGNAVLPGAGEVGLGEAATTAGAGTGAESVFNPYEGGDFSGYPDAPSYDFYDPNTVQNPYEGGDFEGYPGPDSGPPMPPPPGGPRVSPPGVNVGNPGGGPGDSGIPPWLGPGLGAGLGYFGADKLADTLRDIAGEARADRLPFLNQSLEWLNDPNAYMAGPGAAAMDATLRGLSVNGNPIGIPTSMGLANYAGLRDWNNAVTGMANLGLGGQDSRNSLLTGAAQADASGLNALGFGLGQITNPPTSLEQLIAGLRLSGVT